MRVPTRIYASKEQIDKMMMDRTLEQGMNVATLPGIYKYSIVLSDAHQGYGFPIGGVGAFDAEEGIISPGGIGYDINCGVRVMSTTLDRKDVEPVLKQLADALFRNVPAGLGSRRKDFSVSPRELDQVARDGAQYIIEKFGLGWPDDPLHIEENGRMPGADPSRVSRRAKERGYRQLGTLGSGNHFLEIQVVDKIFDDVAAKAMGITHVGQITVMVHTGSRGFGHQICSDYLKLLDRMAHQRGIRLVDRELVYAPIKSKEAQDYLKAFISAVNYAFANRQAISHWVREAFGKVFRTDPDKLGLEIIYDVAHNIAKLEEHDVNGKRVKVYVHRKGATRSLPPNHPLTPKDYKNIGQPVLIPGSMGTASYILVGLPTSLERSFGSAPHGAGRVMSRAAAKRQWRAEQLMKELGKRGILIRADSYATVSEEAPMAYKSSDDVAVAAEMAGLAKRVVRLMPLAVVKG
jgi:tRNA-splicing ligase RtcB